MRAVVGEQKILLQIRFKFIFFKNDGLKEIPRLEIVQREPVSPCIAMAEGGLATAQIARKQVSNTEI